MNVPALLLLTTTIASSLVIAGCASNRSSRSHYPVTHAGAIQKVEEGTVVTVRQVKIDGVSTNMGRIIGASLGTAAGALSVPVESEISIQEGPSGVVNISESSNRHESTAAMAVGGVVGMVVGQKVEKALTAKKAQELTIALDNGETVLVVQEYREPAFYEDERVKLYTTRAGNSLVYHTHEDPAMDPETNAYLIGNDEGEFEKVNF